MHVIRLGVGVSKFLLAIKERYGVEKRRGNTGDRLEVVGTEEGRAGGWSLEPPEVPTTLDDKTAEARARW